MMGFRFQVGISLIWGTGVANAVFMPAHDRRIGEAQVVASVDTTGLLTISEDDNLHRSPSSSSESSFWQNIGRDALLLGDLTAVQALAQKSTLHGRTISNSTHLSLVDVRNHPGSAPVIGSSIAAIPGSALIGSSNSPSPTNLLCSVTPDTAVVVAEDTQCPTECPYAQPILGGACEKYCVPAESCGLFHPARNFADPVSQVCVLPCGADSLIEGCVACAGRGKCAKCASGLLGMSFYALSEDRTKCINQAAQHFRIVLGLLTFLFVLLLCYLFHLSRRPVTNDENVRYALRNHLEAKWSFAFGGLSLQDEDYLYGDLYGGGEDGYGDGDGDWTESQSENVSPRSLGGTPAMGSVRTPRMPSDAGSGRYEPSGATVGLGEDGDTRGNSSSSSIPRAYPPGSSPRLERLDERGESRERPVGLGVRATRGQVEERDDEDEDGDGSDLGSDDYQPLGTGIGTSSASAGSGVNDSGRVVGGSGRIGEGTIGNASGRGSGMGGIGMGADHGVSVNELGTERASIHHWQSPHRDGPFGTVFNSLTRTLGLSTSDTYDYKKPPNWWSVRVHSEDIAGKGIALYFNWVVFVFILAIVIAGGHHWCWHYSALARQIEHATVAPPVCKHDMSAAGATGQDAFSPITSQRRHSVPAPVAEELGGAVSSLLQFKTEADFLRDSEQALNVNHHLDDAHFASFFNMKQPVAPVVTADAPDRAAVDENIHDPSPNPGPATEEQAQQQEQKELVSEGGVKTEVAEENVAPVPVEEVGSGVVPEASTEIVPEEVPTTAAPSAKTSPLEQATEKVGTAVGDAVYSTSESLSKWGRKLYDALNTDYPVWSTSDAPQPAHVHQRYQDYYQRMFIFSVFLYILVTFGALGFHCWQLYRVSLNFDRQQGADPTEFALMVSNLPRNILDGRVVSAFLEHRLNLLLKSAGDTKGVRIVGTSIAYDFYEKRAEVYDEVVDWFDFARKLELSFRKRISAASRIFSLGSHGGIGVRDESSMDGDGDRESRRESSGSSPLNTGRGRGQSPDRDPEMTGGIGNSSPSPRRSPRSTGSSPRNRADAGTSASGEVSRENASRPAAKQSATATTTQQQRLSLRSMGSKTKINHSSVSCQTDLLSSQMFVALQERNPEELKNFRAEKKSSMFVDDFFMNLVGLRENRPLPLKNSGSAYVVFETRSDVAKVLMAAQRLTQIEHEGKSKGNLAARRTRRAVTRYWTGTAGTGALMVGAGTGSGGGGEGRVSVGGAGGGVSAPSGVIDEETGNGNQQQQQSSGTTTTIATGLAPLNEVLEPSVRFFQDVKKVRALGKLENVVLDIPLDEPHENAPVELPSIALMDQGNGMGNDFATGVPQNLQNNNNINNVNTTDNSSSLKPWSHSRELAEELGLPARPRLFHSRLRIVPAFEPRMLRRDANQSGRLPALPISGLGGNTSFPARSPGAISTINEEEDIFLDDLKATDSVTLSSARFHDPVLLNWENITTWGNFWQKIFFGILVMFGTMMLWTILYITYAVFYISLIPNIPGLGINDQSFVKDFLLGLLVGVGNGILYWVIDRVMRSAGFRTRDEMDTAILGVSFVSTFLNVLCDLVMVAYVARSQHLNSIFSGKTGAMGYDQALSSELFRLIMPGYLLVPTMGGPILNFIIPFWLSFWFVRSRSGILGRDATEALRAPDFEISWRYADMLNNFCLCLTLLFFPGENGFLIMLGLGVYLCLVYCLDRYLFFERATLTYYPTGKLASVFAHWFVVPSSITMALVCYWASRAFSLDWDVYTKLYFNNWVPSQLVLGLGMVLIHCLFYLSILRRMNFYFSAVSSPLNMGEAEISGRNNSQEGSQEDVDDAMNSIPSDARQLQAEREQAQAGAQQSGPQTATQRSSSSSSSTSPVSKTNSGGSNGSKNKNGINNAPTTYFECVQKAHHKSARERIKRMEATRLNHPYHPPKDIEHSAVATYFNTNPVFCLRSRYLGESVSGWKHVKDYLGVDEQECFPFLRGNYPNFWKQY